MSGLGVRRIVSIHSLLQLASPVLILTRDVKSLASLPGLMNPGRYAIAARNTSPNSAARSQGSGSKSSHCGVGGNEKADEFLRQS